MCHGWNGLTISKDKSLLILQTDSSKTMALFPRRITFLVLFVGTCCFIAYGILDRSRRYTSSSRSARYFGDGSDPLADFLATITVNKGVMTQICDELGVESCATRYFRLIASFFPTSRQIATFFFVAVAKNWNLTRISKDTGIAKPR